MVGRKVNELKEKIVNIVDKEKYKKRKEKQEDDYSKEIFVYAEHWADLMEKKIANGKRIEDIAESTSHEVDTSGITGFMYGAAVAILARCWIHGEQLRKWHNLTIEIQNEGEEANRTGGVLNPAMLNIRL